MFLRGLKEEIKNWVRALNPSSCDQALELSRHVAIATTTHGDPSGTKGKSHSLGELRILLLVDDDELGGDGEICLAESIIEGECHALEHSRVLTDPSPNFRTLKLMGELNGFPAVIPVDSGATHNFISKKSVAAFGLTLFLKKASRVIGDINPVISEFLFSVEGFKN
ncbi:hypothetical protein Tco_1098432 [Tanacetum coccineum]